MENDAVLQRLKSYDIKSNTDAENVLREIMQELALAGLARGGFFEKAAFYGGTALRLLYGLNRGSEDLDFSLLVPDSDFLLNKYAQTVIEEFASYGLEADFSEKVKMQPTNIRSAFLKSNTKTQLLAIGLSSALAEKIHSGTQMKVKIEVDINPPAGFRTEIKYLFNPIPFALRSYTLPDLLAGKLHAVLFRSWRSRNKGRDWYDLVWYAGKFPEYNLLHLENRARQSGNYSETEPLTEQKVKELLMANLERVDISQLQDDVRRFLRAPESIAFWSKDFFGEIFGKLRAI